MSGSAVRGKSHQLDIPDLDEDPAERKRVLNVLAQRRYRRRKREHVQKLEKTLGREPSNQDTTTTTQQKASPQDFAGVEQPVNAVDFEAIPGQPFLNQWDDQQYIDSLENDQYSSTNLDFTQKDFGHFSHLDSGALDAFDASLAFPLPSLTNSPSMTTQTTSSQGLVSLSPRSQSSQAEQDLSFPDEIHLPILELNLLRGAMAIAKRLEVDNIIWSLDANSPFHNSTFSTHDHLPLNLRPSRAQICNSHHPTFDILPWPSVRNRLILVFSQPIELRPPSARSPTAMIDFVYDLEDPAEGVRIWGDDPYAGENWEVGEKLFHNWWWAFDREVLSRSNELRRNRGASILGMDRNRQVEEIE